MTLNCSFRATMVAGAILVCTGAAMAANTNPRTGLTLTGSADAIAATLKATAASPHRWSHRLGSPRPDGRQSIRIEWPGGPGPGDMGSVVHLTQLARQNGLTISETEIVEVN